MYVYATLKVRREEPEDEEGFVTPQRLAAHYADFDGIGASIARLIPSATTLVHNDLEGAGRRLLVPRTGSADR